jgi:SAM-dependent methyltransferase
MQQVSSSLVLWLGYYFFIIALLLLVTSTTTTTTTTAWLPEQTGLIKQRSSGLVALRSSSSSQLLWLLRNGDNDEVIAMDNTTRPEDIITAPCSVVVSRRNLFRHSALSVSSAIIGGMCYNNGIQAVHAAYTIEKVEPDENDIYATAQQNCWNLLPGGGNPHNNLRVLWIGPGNMKIRTGVARNGVYKDLFQAGSDVTAFDLLTPTITDLSDAQQYAFDKGYTLQFQQGDATKLHTIFADNSFDVVVCSLFLCQDFDPVMVVQEIRQVLTPGGRFGFYEHIENIDTVIVGKVFGESSIIKIEAYPEMVNILAGVVQK